MKQFCFLDWDVYKDAKTLFLEIRELSNSLPFDDRRALGNQMVRSSLSVVLNISEGSGKPSPKEIIRFIDISLGSLYETRAAIDIMLDTEKISHQSMVAFDEKIRSIANQLGGLRKKKHREI